MLCHIVLILAVLAGDCSGRLGLSISKKTTSALSFWFAHDEAQFINSYAPLFPSHVDAHPNPSCLYIPSAPSTHQPPVSPSNLSSQD